jgi:hypothetical protein
MSVGAAGPLVVTYPLSERSRAIVAEELGGAAAAVYLADLASPERSWPTIRRRNWPRRKSR